MIFVLVVSLSGPAVLIALKLAAMAIRRWNHGPLR